MLSMRSEEDNIDSVSVSTEKLSALSSVEPGLKNSDITSNSVDVTFCEDKTKKSILNANTNNNSKRRSPSPPSPSLSSKSRRLSVEYKSESIEKKSPPLPKTSSYNSKDTLDAVEVANLQRQVWPCLFHFFGIKILSICIEYEIKVT